MSGFTPGPWHVSKAEPAASAWGAEHPLTVYAGGKNVATAVHYPGSFRWTAEANTRLIAAAPELLEAVQMVHDNMTGDADNSDVTIEAILERVIAKATGNNAEGL